ncbi:MAG: NADH-quinone oxidoreductase subunit A [Armatimonadetes bacterium]|nr:NADH-quinone oxidoreductase subunit A [Armatimonadota bacterium]
MFSPYAYIAFFAVVGTAFILGAFAMSWFLSPSRPATLRKHDNYECGETPVGMGWVQYNVRYYLFAMVFLIFDVEAIFLIPWAVAFKKLGYLAFAEMAAFLLVLLIGLLYAWRKDALKWV